MQIRNGRFNGDPGVTRRIIAGRDGAIYRILNSGDEDVTIDMVNLSGNSLLVNPYTLGTKFSLDLAVRGFVTVTSTSEFSGIYQYLHPSINVRSGRFRFTTNNISYPHAIIDLTHGVSRAYYRVFNSGNNPITLTSGALVETIEEEQSFDFPANANNPVTVQGANNTTPIEGIYEFLERGE